MMKILTAAIFSLVLVFPGNSLEAKDKNSVLDRDFRIMMEWFGGEYDNMEQVYFEGVLKTPADEKHGRIHSIFKRVDLPFLGTHVFYVQQYSDNDPEKIYRQRFYRFTPNYERHVVALEIFSPKDVSQVKDAHLDPSKLDGLTREDVTTLPAGCTVFWRRQANQFIGFMDDKACKVYSPRSKRTLVFSDDLVLTEDQIWIHDRAEDEAGNYVYGNKAGVPHKLLKQRNFTCWMLATNDKAPKKMQFVRNVKLQDQGGEFWIDLVGQEGKSVGIKMRNVRWPYDPNRDSLVLYAHKDGSDRATSYVWTAPESKRIALNLRWMQASCTLDE
ncbi:chromophore lyase CpcT/CpeT [Temperatibacter marinus]|uniref:Chromophore lyase CpcT/CpeT n=1 Tax=Temperatibacter marinus TaxID=1456591 RepID=A0AA52EGZ8_9PROT|nr:chromophore lyase CpcT/CpeT [Temperatibacter marinus]WND03493.1 chromophore lyase CpcT/CpeT [Temperatibacter marinus]